MTLHKLHVYRLLVTVLAFGTALASIAFVVGDARAATPSVTSVGVPSDGRYGAGRNLDFVVNFDQLVTVTGTPRLVVTFDQGGVRYADYLSGSGTASLRFRMTITAGLADANGVELGANIDVNGGSIRNAASVDVDTTLSGVPSLSLVRVGGLMAYEPFLRNSTNTEVDLTARDTDGSTGFAGPWVVLPSQGSDGRVARTVRLAANSTNMTFPNNVSFTLPHNDGKVVSESNWWPNNVARPLIHPISLDEHGVVYITFLFRDGTANADGQALMGFLTGLPSSANDDSKTAITFGYGYGTPVAGARGRVVADIQRADRMAFCGPPWPCTVVDNGSYTVSEPGYPGTRRAGVSTADNKSWFMVAEITTVPVGNDRIRLKAFGANETVPSSPADVVWDIDYGVALTGSLTHASVQLESSASSELDEMRIASSYADVVGRTPAAPNNLGIIYVAGDTEATVSATAPDSSGGSNITGYLISATPTNGGPSITIFSATPEAHFTGLDPASTYTFSIAAVNADGIGTAAGVDPGLAVAPPSPPGVPGIASVVAGSGEATVSVSAPAGGGEPESYVVTATPDGASCTVVVPETSCVVSPLTNGTSYTFSAVAVNAGGSSAASAASAAVTPQVPVPGVPGIASVVAGDGRATVTVVPGVGGGEVVDFVVTAQPGAHTCAVTPPQTACVLTGLTNGVEHTITVTANNAGGSSAPSGVALVRPFGPPLVPDLTPITAPTVGQPQGSEAGSTGPAPTDSGPVRSAPASPGLDDRPSLAPGQWNVAVDARPVTFRVEVENATDVVMRSSDVALRVSADCAGSCRVRSESQGRVVLEVQPQAHLRVSGSGWLPRGTIEVWLYSEPVHLGVIEVGLDGTFDAFLAMGDIAPGDHTLQISGPTPEGTVVVHTGVVVVGDLSAPVPSTRLPATGAQPGTLLTLVVLLWLMGAALACIGRRTTGLGR